jgi:Protein of unknown function (DUF3074)
VIISVWSHSDLDTSRMIQTSTPGGYIPQFIVERMLPAKLAQDVPSFLSWLKTHPTGKSRDENV